MKDSKLSSFYAGDKVQCPFCEGSFEKFIPYGIISPAAEDSQVIGMGYRSSVLCPGCLSSDRERLVYLYLKHKTGIFHENITMLHVAPERNLQRVFTKSPTIEYLSADFASPLVMVRIDVAQLPHKDNLFDVIICNHVLEHVPDDQQAMAELYRVLKPGGWAILQVPISMSLERTYEDPNVTSPQERERLFGQRDHVRIYAKDYIGRLEGAGFRVETYNLTDDMGESFADKHGLIQEENLYVCSKPRINS